MALSARSGNSEVRKYQLNVGFLIRWSMARILHGPPYFQTINHIGVVRTIAGNLRAQVGLDLGSGYTAIVTEDDFRV